MIFRNLNMPQTQSREITTKCTVNNLKVVYKDEQQVIRSMSPDAHTLMHYFSIVLCVIG